MLYDRTVVEAGEGAVDQKELDIGVVLFEGGLHLPVSYTHLTLPNTYAV